MLLKNLRRRVEIADKAAGDQPRHHRIAQGNAVDKDLAEGSQNASDLKGGAALARQRFGLAQGKPAADQQGQHQIEAKDRPPVGHQQNALAQHRRDNGH